MEISNSKNINAGNINSGGGNVHLGDNYYKSNAYKECLERIEEYEDLINSTNDDDKKLRYKKRLNDERNKLEKLKNDVTNLASSILKIGIDTTRLKKCFYWVDQGKYEAAVKSFETKVMTNELEYFLSNRKKYEVELKRISHEFYTLSLLTQINDSLGNKTGEICEYLEKSIKAKRDTNNLFNYAQLLYSNNRSAEAEPYYEETLEIQRKLVKYKPDYLSDLANTLRILANLKSIKFEYEKAERYFLEALEIYRRPIDDNQQIHLDGLAFTLSGLSQIFSTNGDFVQAEKLWLEALELYRKLAEENPLVYLLNVANTLGYLGNFFIAKHELEQAEEYSQEALEICRKLAEENPHVHLKNVGVFLALKGVIYKKRNERGKAKKVCQEAIELYRNLAKKNPEEFILAALGLSLVELSSNERKDNQLEESLEHGLEALELYRNLAEENPQTYLINVGMALGNIGQTYLDETKEFDNAVSNFEEALKIIEILSEENPQIFALNLVYIQINMAECFAKKNENKNQSLILLDKAIASLNLLEKSPQVENYLTGAYRVLEEWGIDVEKYLR